MISIETRVDSDAGVPFNDNDNNKNAKAGGGGSDETKETTATPTESLSATTVEDPEGVVPQLAGQSITYRDLQTAIRVLSAMATLNPSYQRKKRKKGNAPTITKEPAVAPSAKTTTAESPTKEENGKEEILSLEDYKKPNLRPFRKALAACLELHKLTMFEGKEENAHYQQRIQERSLKRQKMAERALHKKYIAATQLRKGRMDKLKQLQDAAREEEEAKLTNRIQQMAASATVMMIPDGHVDSSSAKVADETIKRIENGETTTEPAAGVQLPKLRSCYVCKVRYRELHHFYDQLCPGCAAVNWNKRFQTCSLKGRIAVVTGARVKIGFQVCLKLLRAGCTVVATTRFPNAAAAAYRKEDDFEQWKDQLVLFGLDLRDVVGLEAFVGFLRQHKFAAGVDILINNACQTVRRPVAYYKPAVNREQELWKTADKTHKALLVGCLEFEKIRRKLHLQHKQPQQQLPATKERSMLPSITLDTTAATNHEKNTDANNSAANEDFQLVTATNRNTVAEAITTTTQTPFETTGLCHAAAMSQMMLLPEDTNNADEASIHVDAKDVNGQPLDLRTTNSWLLKMQQVSTPELTECLFVNCIAPFVLNARLQPLMCQPAEDSRPDRYIINVSAMEGKFTRYKTPHHPHTNMAKAALNMMTRTSAGDLAEQHRIFMNSVDTGWINDENPLPTASKIAATNLFQTPIDEVDAAARIVDPIFTGVNGGEKVYGKFLKDYKETEW